MADEASWQNHVKSPQRGSVSANVNTRREGPVERFDPEDNNGEAADADEQSEHERAVAEGYDDKWQKRFSHLPGVAREN